MKKKYKILFAFMCILILVCFNVPVSAVTDYMYSYGDWLPLSSQSDFTDLPQLFYKSWNTGNNTWFQGNDATGILPGQARKVYSYYVAPIDSVSGLWLEGQPGMTYNYPDAYIGVIDASVIGLNMPYNFGRFIYVQPPSGGYVRYKVNVLFRWNTQSEYPDPDGKLIFNNVSVFGYTRADRSAFIQFDFVDYNWTSGASSHYSNFYQRVFEFETALPVDESTAFYGFMIKFEGHFVGNYVENFYIGLGDLMYQKVVSIPVIGDVAPSEEKLSSITNGVNDLVYSNISPLTNSVIFNKISNGALLANSIINRITALPWLNYMLIFSLAVGVVGFLFSFTGKVHR